MKIKNIFILLFALILVISCKLAPTDNNYINVPDNYATIQKAIDASAKGDTILVEPGTYFENINFIGKEIVVASHFIIDGNEEHISNTIIDGDNSGSVVTFENAESENAKLIGFTLQNGKATNWSVWAGQGGGIYCSKASPTLKNLIIRNNYGSRGGGICFDSSNSIVRNCWVYNNESDQEGGGAGIYIRENSSIEIYDSRISHNTCVSDDPSDELWGSLQGAGILIWRSDLYLSHVSIHNNHINNKFGFGGGIRAAFSTIEFDKINRCSIYNNTIAFNNGNNGVDFGSLEIVEVYLDTFTVMNPTNYYAALIENFSFDILNSIF